jgi:hypothetical protein
MHEKIPSMKINPNYYPAIILATFAVFMLIGFLLGLRPQHGGGNGREGFVPVPQYILVVAEAQA